MPVIQPPCSLRPGAVLGLPPQGAASGATIRRRRQPMCCWSPLEVAL